MIARPVRLWLSSLPKQDYLQLKTMYERIDYSGTWEQFLTEIYEEEKKFNPMLAHSTDPTP